LIGIIAEEFEIAVIEKFFQLFKTRWEPYKKDNEYDVIILTNDTRIDDLKTKVFLLFSSQITQFDKDNGFYCDSNIFLYGQS
jgi:hypothetical protein